MTFTEEQEKSLQASCKGMPYDLELRYRAMFGTLSETQARCTELIDEVRALRREAAENARDPELRYPGATANEMLRAQIADMKTALAKNEEATKKLERLRALANSTLPDFACTTGSNNYLYNQAFVREKSAQYDTLTAENTKLRERNKALEAAHKDFETTAATPKPYVVVVKDHGALYNHACVKEADQAGEVRGRRLGAEVCRDSLRTYLDRLDK